MEAIAAKTLRTLVSKDGGKRSAPSFADALRPPWSCPGQRLAILATLLYRQDVVAVLPTGYGKSMVPFVAASVGGMSLVIFVAPLQAVRANAKRSLLKLSIPFQEYEPEERIRDDVRVLLISGDRTSSASFFSDLTLAHRLLRYDEYRVVVDEAHVVAVSLGFRPALRLMNEVRVVTGQIVLLTATLPPAMEGPIRVAYGLQPGAGTAVIRCSTNRPEIVYSVLDGAQTIDQAAKSAVVHFSRNFADPGDRAIVFVNTAVDGATAVNAIERRLGVRPGFYCGKAANGALHESERVSDEDRRLLLETWSGGGSGAIIVGTQALESGHHDAHVRAAYFLRAPASMIAFQQASGRVARDGRPGVSVIYPVTDDKALPPVPPSDLAGVSDVRALVRNKGACVREALTTFADGRGHGVRCREREHAQFNRLCSRCAARSGVGADVQQVNPPPPPVLLSGADALALAEQQPSSEIPFEKAHRAALARRADRLHVETTASAPLVEAIEFLGEHCPVCFMVCGRRRPRHPFLRCPSFLSLPRACDYVKSWAGFRYISGHTTLPQCFWCNMPLNMPGIPHPDISGLTGRPPNCPHADVLKPVAFAIRQLKEWREAAAEAFGQDWGPASRDREMVRWYPEEKGRDLGGRGLTNIQESFVWMIATRRDHDGSVGDVWRCDGI